MIDKENHTMTNALKLKPLANNMNLIDTPDYLVLFSYATPVACYDKHSYDYYRTAKRWSMTTSRHINKWLDGVQAQEKPQEYFDNLLTMEVV
jgi:hypothetical protein